MTSARPAFALDHTTHRDFGGPLPADMDHNLQFWHMVQAFKILPSASALSRAHDAGKPAVTLYVIYERLDYDTHKLWFAEHRLELSKDAGLTKTLTWFDEAGMKDRWQQVYKPLLAANPPQFLAADITAQRTHQYDLSSVGDEDTAFITVQKVHYTLDDGAPDIDKMKRQYTAFNFNTNSRRVGGPTADMMHFGAEPIGG